MNCRETLPLLPFFVDGELDARQMRGVALHATRCIGCEEEIRHIERLQELVAEHVGTSVDEIDLSQVWAGVAPRIDTISPPWFSRLIDWWGNLDVGWLVRAPAYGMAAAVVVWVTLTMARPANNVVASAPAVVDVAFEDAADGIEDIDNTAILDSVDSRARSVAMLNEPETNTTVLWVSNEIAPNGAGVADDSGELP